MAASFDFIIVGGGTAGCVLASRLSEYLPESSILLIEAGVKDDPRIRPALGLTGQAANEIKWNIQSVPQRAVGNKTIDLVQGKVLGGTSAINHQLWSRGSAGDFDQWAAEVGDERWSWDGQLPFFKNAETFYPGTALQGKDLSAVHGFNGPIKVSQTSSSGRPRNFPLKEPIASMYKAAGISQTADLNSGDILGFTEVTSNNYDGIRQWAGGNYSFGSNVTLWTETHVSKIVMKGSRARGVEYLRPSGGTSGIVSAKREVIVSSGAQGSPKLLLLRLVPISSVISDKHDIEQVTQLPVGENYSDHPMLATYWHLEKRGLALGDVAVRTAECDWTSGLPVDWVAFHRHDNDRVIKSLAESQLDSKELDRFQIKNRAHTESVVLYGHIDFSGKAGPPPPGSNMCVMNILVTPSSRGTVSLKSTDPLDPPVCDPNMLSNELDQQLLWSAARLTSRGLERTIAPEYGVSEYAVDDDLRNDYGDEAMMRRALRIVRTVNHGSGTCAMGSVVDTECRVNGIDGLRVIDSSVIPFPICAHYQAAVYALAEQVCSSFLHFILLVDHIIVR
ncbi:hypothetical protein BGW36DRAFT_396168 [Talaromyces proteolyticus]|uniref:Glucose-methanol-choline oxidoreductase N-terminal domain-containing protein n=1 Tax=Talaromyces proteolyticus TaxID=1131652 RepID=A0AAD4Q1D3_9EURO|nr:uncharacterized protein BGW36DRAFT_396168 [Talaromyces proteolyticus]KAH8698370.1 hypothetical protein BGW36DRAFT_396168 [Talaromyces proteolyticus]